MRLKKALKRKFNYKTTETSADVLLATLILSGWFMSLMVYLMVN